MSNAGAKQANLLKIRYDRKSFAHERLYSAAIRKFDYTTLDLYTKLSTNCTKPKKIYKVLHNYKNTY